MPHLNLTADEVLTTTRSVRKRLDFARPVETEVIRECLEIALQAPTGGNRQTWHWVVVTDAEKRRRSATSTARAGLSIVARPLAVAGAPRCRIPNGSRPCAVSSTPRTTWPSTSTRRRSCWFRASMGVWTTRRS